MFTVRLCLLQEHSIADTLASHLVNFLVSLTVDALLGPVVYSTTHRTTPSATSHVIVPLEAVLYSAAGVSDSERLLLILVLIRTIEFVFQVVVLVVFTIPINIFRVAKLL